MGVKVLLFAATLTTAAVVPPTVTTLPGQRLPLTPAQRKAGAVEVRRVLVTGRGVRQVPLYVGRTADGRLCVGTRGFFRCLGRLDAQPIYLIGAFRSTWGAVVGLAGPEISRVTMALQQNERHVVRLRRLNDFAWRAFAFPPTGPNGRLPSDVYVEAGGGSRVVWIGLGWIYGKVGDSQDAPVGEPRPRIRLAKALAFADPRVRRLLPPTYLLEAPANWTGCRGRTIGAIVTLRLFRPISIDEDLPFVSFAPVQNTHAYAEGVVHLRADGITELEVGVDLARRRVISIDPGGESIHAHELRIVQPLTAAGAPAPGGCPRSKSD
jgi:hypothetical protein